MTVKPKLNGVLAKNLLKYQMMLGVGSYDDNPLVAFGTSAMLVSSEPVQGQVIDPLFDDFDRDHDEAEMRGIQL